METGNLTKNMQLNDISSSICHDGEVNTVTEEQQQLRRKKRRWDDNTKNTSGNTSSNCTTSESIIQSQLNRSDECKPQEESNQKDDNRAESGQATTTKKRSRWDTAGISSVALSYAGTTHGASAIATVVSQQNDTASHATPVTSVDNTNKAKAVALQQSIAARLAALKVKQGISTLPSSSLQETFGQGPNQGADSNKSTLSKATLGTTIIPPTTTKTETVPPASSNVKKAKVYDFDMTMTTPLVRQQQEERERRKRLEEEEKKKRNPYLSHLHTDPTTIHTSSSTVPLAKKNNQRSENSSTIQDESMISTEVGSAAASSSSYLIHDSRLAGGVVAKNRVRHKTFHFIEPGTYVALAERKRQKTSNAIQSGFVSGRKAGTFIKPTGIATAITEIDDRQDGDQSNYYGSCDTTTDSKTDIVTVLAPRADAPEESIDGSTATSGGVVVIPMSLVMEWWDIELLPGKLKKEVIAREGQALLESLSASSAGNKKKMVMLQDKLSGMSSSVMNAMDSISSRRNIDSSEQHDGFISHEEDKSLVSKVDVESNNEQEAIEEIEITRLRQKCFITASITNAKTSSLIQHPQPVKPLHARNNPDDETPVPTLYLTKKERKRQRKLRRAERQRELQDMQAAGLIPPPEPRLTLSNFIKVLGDQAILDPSKMEAKVMEQIQARKLKHEKMNAERKLTDEQKKAKRTKKLLKEDTNSQNGVVSIALFLVKDMSHRYHRTKVDLNAQQNNITGGVLETPEFSLVICEGGARAVKRYTRLMTIRMKWRGENMWDCSESEDDGKNEDAVVENINCDMIASENDEETAEVQKFNPNNSCELVWTGMAPKRMFNSFAFQSCVNSDMARKVLEAKGVAHFWDQVLIHANRLGERFNLRLGD